MFNQRKTPQQQQSQQQQSQQQPQQQQSQQQQHQQQFSSFSSFPNAMEEVQIEENDNGRTEIRMIRSNNGQVSQIVIHTSNSSNVHPEQKSNMFHPLLTRASSRPTAQRTFPANVNQMPPPPPANAPHANSPSVAQPLSQQQRQRMQQEAAHRRMLAANRLFELMFHDNFLDGQLNILFGDGMQGLGLGAMDPFFGPFGLHSHQMMTDLLQQAFNPQNGGNKGPPPASKKALDALKTKKITEKGISCAVCQDDFKLDEEAAVLPCNHPYHRDCVVPWLKQHNTCPVCRYQLETEDEKYNEELRKQNKRRKIPTSPNETSPVSTPTPAAPAATIAPPPPPNAPLPAVAPPSQPKSQSPSPQPPTTPPSLTPNVAPAWNATSPAQNSAPDTLLSPFKPSTGANVNKLSPSPSSGPASQIGTPQKPEAHQQQHQQPQQNQPQ